MQRILAVLCVWYAIASSAAVASGDPSAALQRGLSLFHRGQLQSALADLSQAARLQPQNALAHLALSRCLLALHRAVAAQQENTLAQRLKGSLGDRDVRMLNAWGWRMHALSVAADMQKARWTVDYAIALYPRDVELWVLRGDLAESALRAAPFYLQALRLQPTHPLRARFHRWVPPPPPLTEAAPASPPSLKDEPPLMDGLGQLEHPIHTRVPRARAYFEQGLRCWYSFVNQTAALDFRWASSLDGGCAMPYWGLSFCLSDKDVLTPRQAAALALHLARAAADDAATRYAAARVLQLRGDGSRQAFLDALDGAILAYPDDVDLWVWRGKVYSDFEKETPSNDRVAAEVPYQMAALDRAPAHPGANHELVHAYETLDRPTLGWRYALAYAASAPHMPHAQHMQAHLAMRLGRWRQALAGCRRSVELSRQGYPERDPLHHLNVLVWALAHTGRFAEARHRGEPKSSDGSWGRLLWLQGDDKALDDWVRRQFASKSGDGYYYRALRLLDMGEPNGAAQLLGKLGEGPRHDEIRARVMAARGDWDAALRLLRRTAREAAASPAAHQWGQGSFPMEAWGEVALQAGRLDDAREAFSEALAHEHASIVGALGMQVACERGRQRRLAAQYAALAARIWREADAGACERLLRRLRSSPGRI